MSSLIEKLTIEVKEMYESMSLLELLKEENLIIRFLSQRRLDPTTKKLSELLNSEIEKKLL